MEISDVTFEERTLPIAYVEPSSFVRMVLSIDEIFDSVRAVTSAKLPMYLGEVEYSQPQVYKNFSDGSEFIESVRRGKKLLGL